LVFDSFKGRRGWRAGGRRKKKYKERERERRKRQELLKLMITRSKK
jgi:hypothetical protein